MVKEKKEVLLTKEIIEKLTADGYCFDVDHAEEIRRLMAEVDAQKRTREEDVAKIRTELKEKSDRIYDLEKEVESLKAELKEKNGCIRDLENEVGGLKDDLRAWRAVYGDMEKQAEEQKAEATKRLFHNNPWPPSTCTDARHRKYDDMNFVKLAPPELLLFAIDIFLAWPGMGSSGYEVALFYPPRYGLGAGRARSLEKALDDLEEMVRRLRPPKK